MAKRAIIAPMKQINVEDFASKAAYKVNFAALSPEEKKNWISFQDTGDVEGELTRIRPNFTADTHLVCHYNPQDGLYDLCYEVPTDQ